MALRVENVTARAGGRTILAMAGLLAPRSALTGLIGPNGAGKSTLLSAILGQREAETGSVSFDGLDLLAMPASERAKLLAYVEQSATTAERLTVRDVVALGRLPFQSAWQSLSSAQDDAIIDNALTQTGMTPFSARLYHTLSGGEQQRVQIARALAQEPQVLLLDEPTSHLDIQAQLLVLDMLSRRARAGCTMVLALHDLNLAARYCDHLVVLKAGHVVAQGAPADVLTSQLLRDVYGVKASVLRLPASRYPLVVYEEAEGFSKAD